MKEEPMNTNTKYTSEEYINKVNAVADELHRQNPIESIGIDPTNGYVKAKYHAGYPATFSPDNIESTYAYMQKQAKTLEEEFEDIMNSNKTPEEKLEDILGTSEQAPSSPLADRLRKMFPEADIEQNSDGSITTNFPYKADLDLMESAQRTLLKHIPANKASAIEDTLSRIEEALASTQEVAKPVLDNISNFLKNGYKQVTIDEDIAREVGTHLIENNNVVISSYTKDNGINLYIPQRADHPQAGQTVTFTFDEVKDYYNTNIKNK